MEKILDFENKNRHMDIAVIGIGLKIADACTLQEYWDIYENNIDCARELPEHRKAQIREYAKVFIGETVEPEYYKGTYLENLDEFDYEFFKMSPREAQVTDPAQRLLLETICETFDDAGYSAKALKGSKTGVFIGHSSGSYKDNYLMDVMFTHPELSKYAMSGNIPAILPARAAHTLDLKGPCMVLDTACSSSLVAINEACDSLKNHTSSMAIAGGVKLNLLPLKSQDTELGFESKDDKTRAFDAGASGAAIGEGVACVLLKPLEQAEKDHDFIYAVIKGISINHDGTAMGLLAPNPMAQTNVILDALDDAGVNPEDIGYIETHGTATILGDPIEFQGLNNAFSVQTQKKQFCGLSASKSNIGHLYECASIAAFIKAVAAIQNKKIPCTKNFLQPNVIIDFCNSPFYVNQNTKDWVVDDGKLRTCGISAFGLSGTNCHLILQEYQNVQNIEAERPVDILCLSAKSPESLKTLVGRYIDYLSNQKVNLNKTAVNTNKNKMHYQNRLAIVYENRLDLIDKLKEVLSSENLEQDNQSKGIYYSNLEKLRASGPTAAACAELTQDCNEMLLGYTSEEYKSNLKSEIARVLGEIALAYTGGADVDWEMLYCGYCQDKVPLPYYPFKKSHMWVPIEKIEGKNEFKAPGANLPDTAQKLFYQRFFIKKEVGAKSAGIHDCLLVQFSGNRGHGLKEHLESKFNNVITVEIDESMLKIINAETYFVQLYRGIDFSTVSHVVFPKFVFEDLVKNEDDLRYYQKVSLLGLLSLYKCLTASIWKKNNIKIVSLINNAFSVTGDESFLRPECATLFGFGKALNREFNNFHSLCIDFDKATSLENIADEICADHLLDIICYRSNDRYVEGLREVEMSPSQNDVALKDGGIYLVTGGLGGIGFETSMEILRRAKDVTLVLLNRSALPEKSQWEAIVSENNDGRLIKRIERFKELQKYAKVVEYFPVDIASRGAVESMVAQVNEKYGKINGLFHAAGIGGGTSLAGLNEERVMGMISPKVFGAYVLDHATRNQQLDFFVMYSSISTIFSSSDLADYAAGNIYLDTYCEYRKKTQPGVSMTVNWATWSQTGMSVEHNFTIDTLFKSINTKDGISALFSALSHGSGNVVIGELNLDNQIGLLVKKYPVEYSPLIKERIRLLEESQKKEKEEAILRPKPKYSGYGFVEKQLCDICCDVLGYEEINIQDNFFELGSDSILLGHIYNEVDKIHPKLLQITDLFAHPTVRSLSEYILELGGATEEENLVEELDNADDGKLDGEEVLAEIAASDSTVVVAKDDNDVAIIGVGMNLPSASNLDEYWQMLINGINAVREMPDEHKREVENHIKNQNNLTEGVKFRKCAYLDELNKFDYTYFGMSPRESTLIDPAARLFLQCCATAVDDSGYGRNGIKGTNTGVILGYSANIGSAYSRLLFEADHELFNTSLPLNQISMSASKIAYLYDLRGPSMVLDTACSSSLVAIHMACGQIRDGSCDMMLAGGVSLALSPMADKFQIGFESQEEKTRAFAENATGAAVGEGVGVVLLKSLKKALADGDAIYAVIKGSAVNQDGKSNGMAAPNYLAQSEVIQKAWKNADVTPADISYIEAHGTGTPLGDPIEVRGITDAYRTATDDRQICGFGSLKTNIGHLNEASGISGIFKLILMLNHKTIAPSLNFTVPNRNINFLESPLYVVTHPTDLKPKANRERVVVGINGFGMSGTNCHMIMEEAPRLQDRRKAPVYEPYIFTVTAKSTGALKNLLNLYNDYVNNINNIIDLGNLCYNINVGRCHFQYRIAFCFQTREELASKLENLSKNYPYDTSVQECFVGQFAIVPENKTNKYYYEITLKEQASLTAKAEKLITEYNVSGSHSMMVSIMELYVKGVEVAWKDLYTGTYTKMHLPTYPYDRLHCWYKVPEPEIAVVKEQIKLDSYFYEKKWVCCETEPFSKLKDGDSVVIIHDDKNHLYELSTMLKNKGIDVINVFGGDLFKKEENDSYYLPADVESYRELFEGIANKNIKMLIHAKSFFDQSSKDSDEISAKLEDSFFDLINIIKAMSKAHFNNKIELIILANNAYSISGDETYLVPENSTVLSLGKVIEQENPNFNCRAVDIDLETSVECLMSEIMADMPLYMAGYRNNVRYVEELNESVIDKTNENILKENGVYIVTGGTDGIGLETACHISRQISGHIALLGRKSFAEEAEWDALKDDEIMRRRIEKFESIKANECTLDIFACDIGKYDSVKKVLENVRAKYGHINGVVHSAGVSGAGYILRKERESFLYVFNPKIYGVWNLDALTVGDNLDFMLNYSSAVTDSGEAGQSDYVAANSYLDAFTDYRNKLGRKTLTVNWVSWKETGMSVAHGINVDSATKAITTKEGIDSLDAFIKSSRHRVTIGQFNVNENFLEMSRYSKNQVAPDLAAKIESLREQSKNFGTNDTGFLSDGNRNYAQIKNGKLIFIPKSDKTSKSKEAIQEITLVGDYSNEYKLTEKVMGQIYSSILGYTEINVFDNFFEMGGDSVMLLEMHDLIDEKFPDYLSVADLFEYTSVRTLAQYIDAKELQKQPQAFNEAVATSKLTETEVCFSEMSMAQKRVYSDCRLNANKLLYNNPFISDITEFEGNLEEVIDKIVARHEMLRTSFKFVDTKLMQCIEPELKVKIDYVNVPDADNIDFNLYLQKFDFKTLPLFHATVFLGPNKEKILLFDLHHILLDGYSASIFQDEMLAFALGKPVDEPKGQYRDYVKFESEFMLSDEYKRMENYWVDRMKGYDDSYEFPEIDQTATYGSVVEKIDDDLMKKLKTLSASISRSLFCVLYGALTLALSNEFDRNDIVLMVPALNRYRPRFKKILGLFINLLPMRNNFSSDILISDYLIGTAKNVEQDIGNQFCDYSRIMQLLKKENGGKVPKFYFFFDYEDKSIKKIKDKKEISISQNSAKNGIDFYIRNYNNSFWLDVSYQANIFKKEQIDNICVNFSKYLRCFAKEGGLDISIKVLKDTLESPEFGRQ